MKNLVTTTTLVAALVVSGQAFGQSKSKTSDKKQTKSHAMRDNQMDCVTAAGEESSAVAANNSSVTENNSGTVNLSGSSLSGASGVNIVTSSDALVGNGVNVYSGTVSTPLSNSGADVNQVNDINQSSAQEGSISGYSRGANVTLGVTASSDVTKSASHDSSFDASVDSSKTHDKSLSSAHASNSTLSKAYSNTRDHSF